MKNSRTTDVIASENKVVAFLTAFKVSALLRRCNVRKRHGATPFAIFIKIMQLPFTVQSFYHDLIAGNLPGMSKDTVYGFLNNPYYNWRRFLLSLCSTLLAHVFAPLTSAQRDKVFIVDTSIYLRGRSKCTELLCWVRDHVKNRTVKGFRLLTLGWSDGNSFLPMDFALLSSANADKRLNEINSEIPKNSNGYKRRSEALKTAPENVLAMIERAFAFGLSARYVLMDSWFALPSLIFGLKQLRKKFDVICMLKDVPFLRFHYGGQSLSLGRLYQVVKKRRGRALIKANVVVKLTSGLRVRVLFCQAQNKRGWVALLSTDLNLPQDEIIRLYGKRWDIEVFFKVIKQHLRLAKEIQAKSYDALIAHTTIVFTRYTLLACQQRQAVDDRTLDGIFRACIQELQDLTLVEAITRLMAELLDRLRNCWSESEKVVEKIMSSFLDAIPTLILKAETGKAES